MTDEQVDKLVNVLNANAFSAAIARSGIAVLLVVLIFVTLNKVHAADLPLPHRQSMRVAPLPAPARQNSAMSAKAPQLCLETGKEPFPGQTLQADVSCPTGLRWIFQK